MARVLELQGEGLRHTVDGDLYPARDVVRVETGPAVEIVLP